MTCPFAGPKWGYEVVVAADGEEAWRWLESESAPPIAVIDWMMPKISGEELCARVRRHARELAPYLLMLTARTQKRDVTQGLDAGADDYLTKPFDLSELGARLRQQRARGAERRGCAGAKVSHARQRRIVLKID